VLKALLLATSALAADAPPTPGIADNSFLLEEAYNQEFGVVQHISVFSRVFDGDGWAYAFTQEWPMPDQRHQLSVTLPVQRLEDHTGFGDVALNYRYQVLDGSRGGVAFSPRVTVAAPTGSPTRGLGTGTVGFQVNLPVSIARGKRFVAHSNLGASWVPGAENAIGQTATATGFNAGQSVIWLASPTFQPLIELAWTRAAAVVDAGRTESSTALYLSPGVRWAHNFKGGLQVVPGVAIPIGIGPSSGEVGLLLYLSIEHPFRRPRP
jgi:hypothetical protein